MAEDWIKMRTGIYRDPKVCIIADLMSRGQTELNRQLSDDNGGDVFVSSNVIRNATVGALVSVWGVMRHRGERVDDDLVVRIASVSVVDDIADLPGFGSAMEAVGWLEQLPDPEVGIRFPRFFSHHNADPDESKREQNRVRQQRFRDKQRNVTVAPKRNAREEKSREEKKRGEETIHPEKKDKDKTKSGSHFGSSGWMDGKTASEMLKAVGVNGKGLEVLGSDERVTPAAVRVACMGLERREVRNRAAVLVSRLTDQFGITLTKGPGISSETSAVVKSIERIRRNK